MCLTDFQLGNTQKPQLTWQIAKGLELGFPWDAHPPLSPHLPSPPWWNQLHQTSVSCHYGASTPLSVLVSRHQGLSSRRSSGGALWPGTTSLLQNDTGRWRSIKKLSYSFCVSLWRCQVMAFITLLQVIARITACLFASGRSHLEQRWQMWVAGATRSLPRLEQTFSFSHAFCLQRLGSGLESFSALIMQVHPWEGDMLALSDLNHSLQPLFRPLFL